MRTVGQTYKNRSLARAGILALAAATLASACAEGAAPPKNARPAPGQELRLHAPPARALDAYARKLGRAQAARTATVKRWGLTAPPPPALRQLRRGQLARHVVRREARTVPVDRAGVSLFSRAPRTVLGGLVPGVLDPGAATRILCVVRAREAGSLTTWPSGYGQRRRGGPEPSSGGAGAPHAGTAPRVPDRTATLTRTAQDTASLEVDDHTIELKGPCSRSSARKMPPLWNEEVFADHWDYREWDRDIHPGDIVLSHFRGKGDWKGTMPDMVRRFMKLVTAKGYAVARLEDYL